MRNYTTSYNNMAGKTGRLSESNSKQTQWNIQQVYLLHIQRERERDSTEADKSSDSIIFNILNILFSPTVQPHEKNLHIIRSDRPLPFKEAISHNWDQCLFHEWTAIYNFIKYAQNKI